MIKAKVKPKYVNLCNRCYYQFPTVSSTCKECKHGLNQGKDISNFKPKTIQQIKEGY